MIPTASCFPLFLSASPRPCLRVFFTIFAHCSLTQDNLPPSFHLYKSGGCDETNSRSGYYSVPVALSCTHCVCAQAINDRPAARRALLEAIDIGDRRAVLKILSNPPHVDLNQREPDGETFLIKAIRLEEREIVRLLLEKGADPNLRAIIGANNGDNRNPQGEAPLDLALETDDVPTVRLLIQHGVNLQDIGPCSRRLPIDASFAVGEWRAG